MILLPFLLIILLIFLFSFYLLGSLLAIILSVITLIFLLLGLFLAERIVLARVRGKALTWYDPLLSKAGNCAYQLRMERPALYETAFLPHSFFYFKSFTGKNYLLLGKEMRSNLSEPELHALISLALIRLKHEKRKAAFPAGFLWSLLTMPRWFFSSYYACLFWDFFFFPLEQFLRWQFISREKIFYCDQLAVQHLKAKVDLASALYKMKTQEERSAGHGLASVILPYFSLVGTKERRILNQFLGDCQYSDERYQILVANARRPL